MSRQRQVPVSEISFSPFAADMMAATKAVLEKHKIVATVVCIDCGMCDGLHVRFVEPESEDDGEFFQLNFRASDWRLGKQ